MNNVLDKIRNTRILAAVGIVCLILGTILTYVKFSIWGFSESISLWGYWEGKIILVIAITNLLFIFKDIVEKYAPKLFETNLGRKIANINNSKVSLIPTILIAVLSIYLHTQLDIDSSYASYGLGFYALWIGIIALVAYGVLHKNTN